MERFLIISLIIVVLFAIGTIFKRSERNGNFLKFPISNYYRRINEIVTPYIGLKCIENLLWTAQKLLKNVALEYKSYKEHGTLEHNGIHQILMEKYNDRINLETFALIYIFTYKFRNEFSLDPSDEEKIALISLREYCRGKLLALRNDIPDCFWDEFELDLKTLERKAYWF